MLELLKLLSKFLKLLNLKNIFDDKTRDGPKTPNLLVYSEASDMIPQQSVDCVILLYTHVSFCLLVLSCFHLEMPTRVVFFMCTSVICMAVLEYKPMKSISLGP